MLDGLPTFNGSRLKDTGDAVRWARSYVIAISVCHNYLTNISIAAFSARWMQRVDILHFYLVLLQEHYNSVLLPEP